MTAGTAVPTTSDATFATDVLASDRPVLVEFSAEWCGPCKMLAPVLDQIATENAERLSVVTIDVDTNPETARAYQVLGMPTMLLFRGGEPVASLIGARPKRAILQEFEPYLPAGV